MTGDEATRPSAMSPIATTHTAPPTMRTIITKASFLGCRRPRSRRPKNAKKSSANERRDEGPGSDALVVTQPHGLNRGVYSDALQSGDGPQRTSHPLQP